MMTLCCTYIQQSDNNWWEIGISAGTLLITILLSLEAKKQLPIIQNQSAENIILKQIDFYYTIKSDLKKSLEEISEKDVFQYLYDERLKKIYKNDRGIYSEEIKGDIEKINQSYKKLYSDYGYLLGHYFRNLYRIFKKIEDTKTTGFDKNHYAKLVRAQLSEYEVLLLFYNCIWVGDDDKFKLLIEKYNLLEGINYEKLLDKNSHRKIYEDEAYGDD